MCIYIYICIHISHTYEHIHIPLGIVYFQDEYGPERFVSAASDGPVCRRCHSLMTRYPRCRCHCFECSVAMAAMSSIPPEVRAVLVGQLPRGFLHRGVGASLARRHGNSIGSDKK